MSIVSITVAVPVSGDGPIVDISALVGPKTVQLTGTFDGYYDLLVSHNGVNFTAAVAFDASGPEGLKQTIPGAFNYVRLHANAQSPSGVTCSVAGVSAVGENGFSTIATLAAGFSGLTTIIDTSTFIAPTGSEADTNFICQGDFQGPIVVLGSADGVLFNPIGEFRVDRRPEGAPTVVALTPLVTETKVRYVRLHVTAVLQGAVVVTMGGRVPATGGGGGGTPMDVFVSTGAGTVYQGLGNVVASTLGQFVVVIGVQNTIDPVGNPIIVVIGPLNVVSHDSINSNIVGHANLVQNQGANSSIIGNSNVVTNSADGPTFVGGDTNVTSCQFGVVVGDHNLVGIGNNRIYVVGSANTLNPFTSGSMILGHDNQVQSNAANSAVVGNANTINETSNGPVVVVGYNNNMGSQRGVIVGHSCSTYPSLSVNILVGYLCLITSTSASHNILVGDVITTSGQDDNILIGRDITIASGDRSNVVIGHSLALGLSGSRNLVISPAGSTLNLESATDSVIFGNFHTIGKNLQHILAAGDAITVLDDLEQCVLVGNNLAARNSYMVEIGGGLTIGTNTGASIIISYNSNLGNDSNSCVLIHNGAIGINSSQGIAIRGTIGDNSQNCAAIANGTIGTIAGVGSPDNLVMGFSTIADEVSSSVIIGGTNGGSCNIASGSHDVLVFGQSCNVGAGSTYVVAIGSSVNVVEPSSHLVAIGDNLNLTGLANSVVIGQQITLTSVGTSDNVIIGNDILFSGGTFGIGVAIGWSIRVEEDGQGIVIGPNTHIGSGTYGVAIGPAAQVAAVDATKWCLALGAYAEAAGGECIIGHSDNVLNPSPSVHLFAVRGYNGADLDTIAAIDNPADGSTGLSVVYNTGGTFSNKTIKAAASPPVGSLLLYVDP
jgi:hypothetical protein